jgi:hypothetical protein
MLFLLFGNFIKGFFVGQVLEFEFDQQVWKRLFLGFLQFFLKTIKILDWAEWNRLKIGLDVDFNSLDLRNFLSNLFLRCYKLWPFRILNTDFFIKGQCLNLNLPFGDFLFLFYKDTLFAFNDSGNLTTAVCIVLAFFQPEWKNVSKCCPVEIFVKMTRVCCWSHYLLQFLLLVLWYHWNEWVLHQAVLAVTGLAVFFNFVQFILGKSLEIARFFIFHFEFGAFGTPGSYQLTKFDIFGFFLPMLRRYFFLFVGLFSRVVQMSGL